MPDIEIPGWADATPEGIDDYQLAYFQGGREMQFIAVTRQEFIALKQHLAGMRGLLAPEQEVAAAAE